MSPLEYLHNHTALAQLEPFLVATPQNRASFNLEPFGVQLKPDYVINPLHSASAQFCDLLQALDGATFGPEGMPMEKWVFYDICYMPGFVFGFGIHSSEAPDELLSIFGLSRAADTLIPITMYSALPMARRGSWMGHNLCSISSRLTSLKLRGVGTLAKSLALKITRAEQFFGATQWSSIALNVHVKFGPLELYTAYTPAHSEAHTLTYGFQCEDRALLAAIGHPDYAFERPTPDLWINSSRPQEMIELHDRISEGERFVIPHAPRRRDQVNEVPIAHLESRLLSQL